ncbi:MAG: type II toxin-antitoxin system tRNA(fMet)-specific endonuclease VapC [Thermodesulfobacteriota bacterium]
MNYLIDTNICIYIMNQRPREILDKCRQFQPGDIAVSAITVSELQYGAAKSSSPSKNQARLDEFLLPFEILPYDAEVAKAYGTIRSRLEKQGKSTGPLDFLIAAHALSRDLILVTNNEKEFAGIQNLRIENWLQIP